MAVEADNTTVKGFLGKATALGREVIGAKIQDILHFTGSGANDTIQGNETPGGNIECSEIMCMGHPSNTGPVWVKTGETATTGNAWPLDAGEVINFNVANLNELRMLIVVSGEALIVAYA
jgi:hypothetical protein